MLCRSCGLCCDGTLFGLVRLVADEPSRMRSRGLVVFRRDDGEAMAQRCGALDGTDCSIYPDRPSQCAGYRCLLASALEAGEVSLGDALAVVAEARSLVDTRSPAAAEILRRHFLGRVAAHRDAPPG